ncbi:MAG: hypothetical protein GY862_39770 [Gammaproteobacteria bacterium]|nr:hypothetical protein [Gammaproteobacteria bacterium]
MVWLRALATGAQRTILEKRQEIMWIHRTQWGVRVGVPKMHRMICLQGECHA